MEHRSCIDIPVGRDVCHDHAGTFSVTGVIDFGGRITNLPLEAWGNREQRYSNREPAGNLFAASVKLVVDYE